MNIFCVRIGSKYGPEYEKYIEEKLVGYSINWIREPVSNAFPMQWNKLSVMSLDISEPVCVIDIDILLINNYRELFEYPIDRNTFLSIPAWWSGSTDYSLNGGFYKYYPIDCTYIYDKYLQNPKYWQTFYINNGTTRGPINGEQYFVEDSVKERLDLKLIPNSWVARWITDKVTSFDLSIDSPNERSFVAQTSLTKQYREATGNDYLFLGGEFHDDIKLVHFTNSINKPSDWSLYSKFAQDFSNEANRNR